MKYFKIIYGYNESDYITITENELPKAIWLFKQGTNRAVFENGAVRGQDIMRIVPDWHSVMGWNKGWKMTPDEFNDIKHLEKPYKDTYAKAELISARAIQENKIELLEKPMDEVDLPEKNPQISNGVKTLLDKFKM